MVKNRWRPIVGCALISHRRSLKIFNRYQVRSRIIYCDSHWSYLSHSIEYNGQVIAAANRKYALVNRDGIITTDKIFQAIGEDFQNKPSNKKTVSSFAIQHLKPKKCMIARLDTIFLGRIEKA